MNVKQLLKYFLNYYRHINVRGKTYVPFFTYIRFGVSLRKCKIGKYCYIGENCSLNCVEMGNYCSIAPNVQIGGMEHSYWEVSTSARLSDSCISDVQTQIGNDVWIGAQCYIKCGVKIGDGAVIGAQSLVNKDVPPYSVVFGSPAKVFKYRFEESIIDRIKKSNYWNFPPEKAQKIIQEMHLKNNNQNIHI